MSPEKVSETVDEYMAMQQDDRDRRMWDDLWDHEAMAKRTGACDPEVMAGIKAAEAVAAIHAERRFRMYAYGGATALRAAS